MTGPIYIWQMNDGRWHVSALGGRATDIMTETSMLLRREGLDRGFDTRTDLEAALRSKGFRWWTSV